MRLSRAARSGSTIDGHWRRVAVATVAAGSMLGTALMTAPAAAADLFGARQEALRSDLRHLRSRIERAPGSAGHDLDPAWREAWSLRVESPRDPRVFDRLDQIRDLRRRADRAARRALVGPGRIGASGGARILGPLRQPPPGDLRASTSTIGVGKRFILIQNGLRQAAKNLDQDEQVAARRDLTVVRADLRAFASGPGSRGPDDDPNRIALRSALARLDARHAVVAGG